MWKTVKALENSKRFRRFYEKNENLRTSLCLCLKLLSLIRPLKCWVSFLNTKCIFDFYACYFLYVENFDVEDCELAQFETFPSLSLRFFTNNSNEKQIKGIFKITPDSVAWTNPDAGSENKIAASDLKAAFWTTLHTGCVLQLEMKGGASSRYVYIFVISLSALTDILETPTHRYTGFKSKDLTTFKDHFKNHYKIELEKGEVASTGQSWGHLSLTSHSIVMSGTLFFITSLTYYDCIILTHSRILQVPDPRRARPCWNFPCLTCHNVLYLRMRRLRFSSWRTMQWTRSILSCPWDCTWYSSAKRENFTLSCFNYVTRISRLSLTHTARKSLENPENFTLSCFNYVTRISRLSLTHTARKSLENPRSNINSNINTKLALFALEHRYVPSGAKVSGLSAKENEDDEVLDDVAELQKEIINRCGLGANTGEAIVEFEDKIGNFLTPRGRYKIELYVSLSLPLTHTHTRHTPQQIRERDASSRKDLRFYTSVQTHLEIVSSTSQRECIRSCDLTFCTHSSGCFAISTSCHERLEREVRSNVRACEHSNTPSIIIRNTHSIIIRNTQLEHTHSNTTPTLKYTFDHHTKYSTRASRSNTEHQRSNTEHQRSKTPTDTSHN